MHNMYSFRPICVKLFPVFEACLMVTHTDGHTVCISEQELDFKLQKLLNYLKAPKAQPMVSVTVREILPLLVFLAYSAGLQHYFPLQYTRVQRLSPSVSLLGSANDNRVLH